MPLSDFLKQRTTSVIPEEQPPLKPVGLQQFLIPSQSVQPVIKKKRDLETLEGLQDLAREKGVEETANKIIQKTRPGEKPDEIFSGGFISDVFDVLSVGNFAVAGFAKEGVKGISKGIRERASFTDPELLGRYGTPGTIAGVLFDVFADPINLIPVFGLGSKALDAIKQGTKFIANTKVAKPLADALGRAFVYRFGQNPVYAKLAEKTFRTIARGQERALEIAKPIAKLSKADQVKIGQWLKGEVDDLPANLIQFASKARNEFKELGEEAVRLGLLDGDTYFANINRYMPRLYTKYEMPGAFQKFMAGVKPVRADLARFMKRQDIPDEIRKAMGEILEAGFPVGKGIAQLRQSIEMTKFFGEVSVKFAKEAAEEGFSQLPRVKTLGALAGKYVPTPIFDDIQEILKIKTPAQKALGRVVAGFKFGKVVMNPATHARNILSNFVLNNFEGLSPARLDIYARAAKSLLTKDELYREAKNVGLGLDTFASQEIKQLLTPRGKVGGVVHNLVRNLSNIYQKEEEFAKMAMYIFQKGKGLSPDDAFRIAERATFNYAQVTPFIRKLRESIFGFPFVTFTYKATPQVLRTVITRPGKISSIGKIARGVESLSPKEVLAEERAVEPNYIRDGFFVRLPNKDKLGRSGYFDLTYIIPFGDLVSGQFFGSPRPGESRIQSILREQPLFNAIAEIGANKDFFGQPIIKPDSIDPEQQGLDIFKYLARFYGPPSLFDFPFRLQQSAEFEAAKPEERVTSFGGLRQTKTLAQEALRGLLGLKVQPIDVQSQRTFADRDKRKALEEYFKAKGIISEFKKPFIPKGK